jgi:hypothetical protein
MKTEIKDKMMKERERGRRRARERKRKGCESNM